MATAELNYIGSRVCGVEDRLGVGEMCRWRNSDGSILHDLTVGVTGSLPNLERASIIAALQRAYNLISAVCHLNFVVVNTPSPHINVTFGSIDNRGNVLAWSEMPCGNGQRRLTQKYDIADNYVIATNPPPDRVSFELVALHETGHAVGVPHLSGGLAVMNPTYNPDLKVLQPLDISYLVTLYGPPVSPPTPQPPEGEYEHVELYMKGGQLFVLRNNTYIPVGIGVDTQIR